MNRDPGRRNWFLRVLGFGPYFRRRSGGLEGLFVASFVGAVSGVYIFKPILDEIAMEQAEQRKQQMLEQQQQQQGTGITSPQQQQQQQQPPTKK